MDPTQPQSQPQPQPQPTQAPQPVPVPAAMPQPPQQFPTAPIAQPVPLPHSSTAKTVAGVLTLIFSVLTFLIGLVSLISSALVGLLMLAVAITWFVLAIQALSKNTEKSAKALRVIATIAIVYAGILLIAGLGLPGFSLTAAGLPVIFAVVIAILSRRYQASVRA